MSATLPLTIGLTAGEPRRAQGKTPARSEKPAVAQVGPAARRDTPAVAQAGSAAGGRVDAAHDIAAWVRHAGGANGFGGDALLRGPLSYRLLLQARANRSAYVAGLIAAVLAKVAAGVRQAHAAYRRHREARVMRTGLHELDDRTLRDIGFTRSEIGSVIAEATGDAEWTRLRTRWLHGHL